MNSTHFNGQGGGGFGARNDDDEMHQSRTSIGLTGQYKTSQSFFPPEQQPNNNNQRKSHEFNGTLSAPQYGNT